jgi:hypothetical protein
MKTPNNLEKRRRFTFNKSKIFADYLECSNFMITFAEKDGV